LEGTTPIQAFLRQIAWIPTYSSVDQDDGIEETLVAIARAAHLPTFFVLSETCRGEYACDVFEICCVMCGRILPLFECAADWRRCL